MIYLTYVYKEKIMEIKYRKPNFIITDLKRNGNDDFLEYVYMKITWSFYYLPRLVWFDMARLEGWRIVGFERSKE
jgi:hypothetical protein